MLASWAPGPRAAPLTHTVRTAAIPLMGFEDEAMPSYEPEPHLWQQPLPRRAKKLSAQGIFELAKGHLVPIGTATVVAVSVGLSTPKAAFSEPTPPPPTPPETLLAG